MGIDYSFLRDIPGAICKPSSRQLEKGRKDRAEHKTKGQVRAECVERDGYCRPAEMCRSLCAGQSEWAHVEPRSATRGMEPTRRHSTMNSMMCCKRHHMELDAHLWDVIYIDAERGADGPIEVSYR